MFVATEGVFVKFDPIRIASKFSNPKIRNKVLDVLLTFGIPFNRWLGMKIVELTSQVSRVQSKPVRLRENHVGTAHACALALLGEYTAGLLIANNYSFADYRIIIGSLSVEYHKKGRGFLLGEANAPEVWPKPGMVSEENEAADFWIEMTTEITNEKRELVAICRTKWQIKAWKSIVAHS